MIPVVAVFLSSGEELLKLLYLRGEFDLKGIELTMKPYYWDVLALITFVLYILPTAYFLAGKDYKRLTIAEARFTLQALCSIIFSRRISASMQYPLLTLS